MTSGALTARGALWARPRDVEEQALALWRAALIAFGIELVIPFLVFGVDWSWLPSFSEPPPVPVMSVRLDQPPPELQDTPPPPKKEKPRDTPPPQKKLRKLRNQVPIEPPQPLPNEVPSKIELPRPEPKPEPKPEQKKPEPEPEAPPLPSVFRDVKPVKKVKPKYPREAEDAHIQGRVRVRLSVDLEGNVTGVKVLLAEPAGVFEANVLEAVRQYKFKRDGTSYEADQEILFKLDD